MKRLEKIKDKGTIFNPVMYLVLLFLSVQLLILFIGYKRMMWLSATVTDSMTDALLGACTLNTEELYHYGRTNELEIFYPREKYDLFKDIFIKELGLTADMTPQEGSIPIISGEVRVTDFKVFSVCGTDITVYDFNPDGSYTTEVLQSQRGALILENGEIIDSTAMLVQLEFPVMFFKRPIMLMKYHMVDVTV